MSSYRRPRHHTYDYNFKVGESSYRDMLDYLDRKEGRRAAASPPPVKKSFAERFAERPIYGEPPPLKLYQSQPPAAERRTTERPSSDRLRNSERPSSDRWTSDPTERVGGIGASPRPGRRQLASSLLDDEPVRPSRAAPNEDALEMDPEELIASIRRGRAKRLELLSSLEADAAAEEEQSSSRRRKPLRLPSEEPEEPPTGRLRQLRLTGDNQGEETALTTSSSSYSSSAKRSVSSKMQSSSSTTSRSVHYE